MTFICPASLITEADAKGFKVNGRSLIVTRKNERIHVYVNSCPHLGINLEFQPDTFLDKDKRFIQCANHGALFEIETGECLVGPCTGQFLTALPFQVIDGNIILS